MVLGESAQSYDQFAQGYADTGQCPTDRAAPGAFIDAGRGNLHAAIPTVLVATKRDGRPALAWDIPSALAQACAT